MRIKILFVHFRSQNHYSIWNPLSIETLIGHLQGVFEPRVEIDVLDVRDYIYLNDLKRKIENNSYNIIGFSIPSFTLKLFYEAIKQIKFKDSLIVLGNQLPTYVPEEILKYVLKTSNIQYNKIVSVFGEGEEALEVIVSQLLDSNGVSSSENKKRIPNIKYFETPENIVVSFVKKPDLSSLNHPPKYIFSNDKSFIQMQLSRGCYWGKCTFCTRKSFRNGKGWESFPIQRIKDDLRNVILNRGIKVIEFCDDEFFGGRKKEHIDRAYQIVEHIDELKEISKIPVQLRLFTRPDFIYVDGSPTVNNEVKKLLKRMKNSGLNRIYIGVESGSETQLKRYNRGMDKKTIMNAINVLKEIDLQYDSGYIMFDKDVKLEEIVESIDFYNSLDMIEANQWIWRPMVVNVGSSIGNEISKVQSIVDTDSMSIPYTIKDKIVEKIYDIIDIKSSETKELFYGFKAISKENYDYAESNSFNAIAHKIVKANGFIYVQLLKKITEAFIEADKELDELINKCKQYCEMNIFSQEDQLFIYNAICKIRPNILATETQEYVAITKEEKVYE